TLAVTNSTFSGNGADLSTGLGGAIYTFNAGTATVTNSTFSGNSASSGGGIHVDSGTATLTNSILSNVTGGNCSGSVDDGGDNISSDGSCDLGISTGANGQTLGDNVNPLLSASGLQNNGG